MVSCEKTEDLVKGSIESGKEYTITYVIDEKGLNDAIGLELVTTYTAQDGKQHVYSVEPFNVVKKEGTLYTFQAKHKLEMRVASRFLTVCSRRMQTCLTVKTSAMFAGSYKSIKTDNVFAIWQNTLSVQMKDIICMMQADHPFTLNGWSVSF